MKLLCVCWMLMIAALISRGYTHVIGQQDSGLTVIGVSAAGVRNRGQDNFSSPTFSIAIRNLNPKAVSVVDWDLIVVRRLDQGASQWYQLKSKVEMEAGATKSIKIVAPRRAGCVEIVKDVGQAQVRPGKGQCMKVRPQADEQERIDVLIRRVEFTDGTAWESS